MTEDMHEERLHAVEAFGDAFVSFISFIVFAISFSPYHPAHLSNKHLML